VWHHSWALGCPLNQIRCIPLQQPKVRTIYSKSKGIFPTHYTFKGPPYVAPLRILALLALFMISPDRDKLFAGTIERVFLGYSRVHKGYL
jgi:hypothetical protein